MPGKRMGDDMKKTALMIVLAAGAFSLSACNKKADEAAPVAEATSEAAADATAASSDAGTASEDAGAAKAAAPAGEGDGKGNDVKM